MTTQRKAPRTVTETAAAIVATWYLPGPCGFGASFDGLREPEIAAWLGLDEDLTYKAMVRIAKSYVVSNRGDRGWFRG